MVCDDGGPDLFVHQSAIKVDGERYRAVLPGTEVSCEYYLREGKQTAREVTARGGAPLPGFSSKLEVAQKLSHNKASVAAPPGMLTGTVKFMSRRKGFGFIIPNVPGDEVFVHVQDVDGHSILSPGEPVAYATAVKKGSRAQAVHVTSLRPQQHYHHSGYQQQYSPYPQAYDQYRQYGMPSPYGAQDGFGDYGMGNGSSGAGNVKWFNEQKGFGFIIPATGGPDVYFKGSDVQPRGPLEENEPVLYETKTGADGKVWAGIVTRAQGDGSQSLQGNVPNVSSHHRQGPLTSYTPYTTESQSAYDQYDQYEGHHGFAQNAYGQGPNAQFEQYYPQLPQQSLQQQPLQQQPLQQLHQQPLQQQQQQLQQPLQQALQQQPSVSQQ